MGEVTWNIRSALVSWTYELPFPPPRGNEWVVEWLNRLSGTLGDFGRLSSALLELSAGDDLRFALPAEWEALLRTTRDLAALRLVDLDLDLHCRTDDGGEVVIPEGGSFGLSLRRMADGVNAMDEPPLLHFSLNTDIYNPDSSGGDNEETGALNAPLLRAFLERIDATGARYVMMDNPYARHAHRYGFD
jgi:hypothetical protein